MSRLVSSCLVLSRLVSSCLVMSRLVLSWLDLTCLVLSRLVLSGLFLSNLVSSSLVLSCPVFSCLILSRLVLSRLVLPCHAMRCLTKLYSTLRLFFFAQLCFCPSRPSANNHPSHLCCLPHHAPSFFRPWCTTAKLHLAPPPLGFFVVRYYTILP